jgi:hypothetical protein
VLVGSLVAIPLNLLFCSALKLRELQYVDKAQFKASQMSATWSERMKQVRVCLDVDISQVSAVAANLFATAKTNNRQVFQLAIWIFVKLCSDFNFRSNLDAHYYCEYQWYSVCGA